MFVLFAAGHNHRAVLNLKFRRHVFGQLNGRAAFYVSGAEDGAPVAYLDESRLQQLRQTMWDMNEVAYSTYTETVEIEADEPAGDENTDSGDSSKNPGEDTESGNGTESAAAKTVTQTVLLIELTHKTPDEMAQDYAYPINRAAREMLYSAVLQEYDRLRSEEELRRQETKLQVS